MIEVKNLSKNFREREAIKDISFAVKSGEILGFLGPNGAGKSTTMKILSGILAPSSGQAKINGFDVVAQPLPAKLGLGYLPENPPVYLGMRVEEYLLYASALHRVPKAKRAAAVAHAIERCGLGEVRGRVIGNLSKGYRQRVGLAQAITHEPKVLILDEPTVGLDPRQIIEIRDLIRSFAGEHTVILSTHILPEVQATCDRVVVIDRGRVIAEDTLDGITQRMSTNLVVEIHLARAPADIGEQLRKINGVVAVENSEANLAGAVGASGQRLRIRCAAHGEPRPEIARVLVGAGAEILEMRPQVISLEEAFVKLITQDEASP